MKNRVERLRRLRMHLLVCLVGLMGSSVGRGAEPQLLTALEDANARGADVWIYNDIAAGISQAREQDKPIFITFRCVPCKDCSGFDAEVASGSDVIEDLARKYFVAVRQVEMKGVDLAQFQFDHDLNWAAMFVNADGTIYARYGTQSAAGADAYNSIRGLELTMNRVLALHADYPANADRLKGKRVSGVASYTALEMPGLNRKDQLAGATSRKNCIHCHMIHDAQNREAQANGTMTHDLLWRYPLPDNVGMVIDGTNGIRVERVVEGTPAAAARIRAGEDVTEMNGQVITSIADMQWVLHDLPNTSTTLDVRTSRSGSHTLTLADGWKKSDISWRGSMWSVSPMMRTWMPDLPDEKRKALDIADDRLALEVRWINQSEAGGKAVIESGLRQGDVVVALDGNTTRLTPAAFQMHVKLNYKTGDELPVTIIRKGQERTIKIKLVE